jgi:inositol-phosphate phosphatase / L-galactose 1-phosphate phosphatase / histidinol-phosphatase
MLPHNSLECAENWVRHAWKSDSVRSASALAITKADTSPVTAVDAAVEAFLREAIQRDFPDHGIIGEEDADYQVESEYCWVIDPIDGTKAFMSGFANYTTLLALVHNETPILGIIYQPDLDKCWIGTTTFSKLNGKNCQTRACTSLGEALFSTTSPYYFAAQHQPKIHAIIQKSRWHQLGGDGYAFGQLASGNIDAMVESNLQLHDAMALVPIIQSAGGVITDWQGKPITRKNYDRVCVAGSAILHTELLELLNA